MFKLIVNILFFIGVYIGGISTPYKFHIVIDPGHGGKDPGAILGKNIYEKDQNLKVALLTAKLIKILSKGKIKVSFTRKNKNEFYKPHIRSLIANRLKANLYLCIHGQKSVKAFEIYISQKFYNNNESFEASKKKIKYWFNKLWQIRKILRKKSIPEVRRNSLIKKRKKYYYLIKKEGHSNPHYKHSKKIASIFVKNLKLFNMKILKKGVYQPEFKLGRPLAANSLTSMPALLLEMPMELARTRKGINTISIIYALSAVEAAGIAISPKVRTYLLKKFKQK